MRTTVSIRGLHAYGYHGLFDEERSLGQKFLFNVRCELADVSTHMDDRLEKSVGYDALANDVLKVSESQKFKTVEALAETIARTLLTSYPVIEAIDVSVEKHSPPMPHAIGSAAVEIRLTRAEL